jgi:hypothetical protein
MKMYSTLNLYYQKNEQNYKFSVVYEGGINAVALITQAP